MGIKFFLIINKQGQSKLSRYYVDLNHSQKEILEANLVRKCIRDIGKPQQTFCFEYEQNNQNYYVIYRRFASLWIIVGCDLEENELAISEFIDAFMQVLNQIIPNISELDLMFNLEKVYMALDEIIINGQIVSLSISKIRESVLESTSNSTNT